MLPTSWLYHRYIEPLITDILLEPLKDEPFFVHTEPTVIGAVGFSISVKSGTEVAQRKIKKSANVVFTDVSVGAAGGT